MRMHRKDMSRGGLPELFDGDENFVAAEEPELERRIITGENCFAGYF